MTSATPTLETTTYHLEIPFVSTAFTTIEGPAGLSKEEVLKTISWEDTRHVEWFEDAIRHAVLDCIQQNSADISIEVE